MMTEVKQIDMLEDLKHHFSSKVLVTASKSQSYDPDCFQPSKSNPTQAGMDVNCAGKEVLRCMEGLSKAQVCC